MENVLVAVCSRFMPVFEHWSEADHNALYRKSETARKATSATINPTKSLLCIIVYNFLMWDINMLMFVKEFHVSILFELEVVRRAEIHEIMSSRARNVR